MKISEEPFKPTTKNARNVFDWLVVLVTALVFMYLILVKTGIVLPMQLFTIQSGSMGKAIPVGSVVIVQAKKFGYQQGEVITFKLFNSLVTHRVESLVNMDSDLGYKTKGDANQEVDISPITKQQVVGKVINHIPYLGIAIDWMKTPIGFVVMVIIPSTIVIYEELRKIKNELIRLRNRYGNKNSSSFGFMLIPLGLLIVAGSGKSASFLSDVEVSRGNGFRTNGTAVLVINEVLASPTNGDKEWVEVYNAGNTTANINDWKIADDGDHTANLSGTIAGNGYFIFEVTSWFNNSGDTVKLINPEEIVVDSYGYTNMASDKSHGRNPDGNGSWKACGQSSKNETNNEKC